MRIAGLILNDYENAHYATWVYEGKKKIKTRMNRQFTFRGDIVICCGATNSVTKNAGKALCIVELYDAMPMKLEHAEAAMIEWIPERRSHLLKNWRYFSRNFEFKYYKTSGTWQGIFDLNIPDDIKVIPQPHILSYEQLNSSVHL